MSDTTDKDQVYGAGEGDPSAGVVGGGRAGPNTSLSDNCGPEEVDHGASPVVIATGDDEDGDRMVVDPASPDFPGLDRTLERDDASQTSGRSLAEEFEEVYSRSRRGSIRSMRSGDDHPRSRRESTRSGDDCLTSRPDAEVWAGRLRRITTSPSETPEEELRPVYKRPTMLSVNLTGSDDEDAGTAAAGTTAGTSAETQTGTSAGTPARTPVRTPTGTPETEKKRGLESKKGKDEAKQDRMKRYLKKINFSLRQLKEKMEPQMDYIVNNKNVRVETRQFRRGVKTEVDKIVRLTDDAKKLYDLEMVFASRIPVRKATRNAFTMTDRVVMPPPKTRGAMPPPKARAPEFPSVTDMESSCGGTTHSTYSAVAARKRTRGKTSPTVELTPVKRRGIISEGRRPPSTSEEDGSSVDEILGVIRDCITKGKRSKRRKRAAKVIVTPELPKGPVLPRMMISNTRSDKEGRMIAKRKGRKGMKEVSDSEGVQSSVGTDRRKFTRPPRWMTPRSDALVVKVEKAEEFTALYKKILKM